MHVDDFKCSEQQVMQLDLQLFSSELGSDGTRVGLLGSRTNTMITGVRQQRKGAEWGGREHSTTTGLLHAALISIADVALLLVLPQAVNKSSVLLFSGICHGQQIKKLITCVSYPAGFSLPLHAMTISSLSGTILICF